MNNNGIEVKKHIIILELTEQHTIIGRIIQIIRIKGIQQGLTAT